jgi:formate C-acetyltransferase
MTQFYRENSASGFSSPVMMAKAFEYLLRNKKICINDGELIVGERGPAPKETPTYPEISLHSLEDLKILDTREKVFFKVDDEVKHIYENEIIARTEQDVSQPGS